MVSERGEFVRAEAINDPQRPEGTDTFLDNFLPAPFGASKYCCMAMRGERLKAFSQLSNLSSDKHFNAPAFAKLWLRRLS